MQGVAADTPLQPAVVLERKLVRRGNKAAVQFLIQWEGQGPEDASWEDAQVMMQSFPIWLFGLADAWL